MEPVRLRKPIASPSPDKADIIEGLTRGISVIQAFGFDSPQHSASSLALKLDMSRAAARRFLITLEHLGLAATDGRIYWLTPKILALAQSYQSSEQLVRTVTPHVNALSRQTNETCSFGIIEGADVLYVVRAAGPRLLTTNLTVGSRLPLQCAAAGWAIMSYWSAEQFSTWLKNVALRAYTEQTVVKKKELASGIAHARTQGYVLLENQFELGIRGMSVAVRNSFGQPIGALTISTSTMVCSTEEAHARFGDILKEASLRLEKYL